MELLYRNSFKRRIRKLGTGSVTVYQTSLFAQNLSAVLCSCAECAVLTLGLNVVAEIFLLCHMNVPFL